MLDFPDRNESSAGSFGNLIRLGPNYYCPELGRHRSLMWPANVRSIIIYVASNLKLLGPNLK